MINKRSFLGISMVRRRTRRWVVAGYWVVVLVFLGLAFFAASKHQNWLFDSLNLPYVLVVSLSVGLLGGTSPGGPVRDFSGRQVERPTMLENVRTLIDQRNRKRVNEDGPLDERDIRLRNAAHYESYRAVRWMVLWVL